VKMQLSCGLILGLSIVGLASCSSAPEAPVASSPDSRPEPQAPVYRPPVAPKPAPAPVYKPMAEDQCGAAALQGLVGKPRTEIPVPLDPGKRRVVCSSCIVTQEYRSDRQTIIFSSDTGIIESVKCG
jgi:hypothetical protein